MSDPFASSSDGAARYPTPPWSPPPNQSPAGLFPPAHAAPSARSSMSSTKPQQGHASSRPPNPPTPSPDEFGAYRSAETGTSQSTSATRPRPSQTPSMPIPIPAAEPIASTSNAHASSHTHTAQQNPRQRQSHNPSATLGTASPPKPENLTDEYVLHPSVWAYKTAHPRRPMVGFGPYVLLQTLGEGEFGKVKLGVHTEFGVEVAIKLIRRGSLEDEVRASKVEREIDVLKTLKHPNIVRMFDVIDTEKYIGIVLEFAGGGELFDHILANRYLKEKDAQKLFAQLVSGVDYLHKKHIVHRDLKLENLLLDKHRNIIITDFGFANRFDHAADDLMATSCGSPCYAAPELVVSEGLYVGSAVDIWSCGVILYAMLSGYLPYDDDPANPDGDNINLLYKYIMNTKLNFPDHMTAQAKHLLQIMLVPDPEYRCRIEHIMQHPWLSGQRDFFDKTVEEQEHSFQENMYRKSQVAKRELGERKRIQQEAKDQKAMQRSQSSLPGTAVTASLLEQRRAKEPRHHSTMPGATTMPEYLSNAGSRSPPLVAAARPPLAIHPPVPAASHTSPVIADTPVVVSPDTAPSPSEVPPPSAPVPTTPPRKRAGSIPPTSITPKAQILASKQSDLPSLAGYSTMAVENEPMDVEHSPEARPPMSANKNRHTIQVEYDGEASYEKMTEVYEAKRAARSPQDEGSPKASGASSLVPLASSDIEMESVSSESGHARERRSESPAGLVTSEAPSPDASQVLTPLATTPPATAILEAAPIRSAASTAPTTPSKQAQSIHVGESTGSPSTPRAAANTVQADLATPRGDSSNVATPKASLQQPSKRLESPAQAAASVASSEPIPEGKSADLTSSGLPKVPPPKRDRNRKGMSLDKFGLARLLGQAGSSLDVSRPPSSGGSAATIQAAQNEVTQGPKRTSLMRPRTADVDSIKDKKTSRRRTFQQMVNRSLSPRDGKPAAFTPVTPAVTPLAPRDMNPTPLSQGTQSPPMIIDGEGIQPQVMHARGLSSPSIVTVDAFSTQPAEDAQGHKTASSSAAKKVMDWFRRKSLAKDTLVNLKSAGIKSDSLSSFVRVSNGPARGPQPMAGSMANLAMSSTSSIAHTAQGTPNITVTDPAPVTEPVIDYTTSLKEMPESVRIRLGPAGSKINVVVPPAATSTASLLSPSRAGSMPIPSRSKSHHPADTAAASATSTVPPFKAAFRPSSTRSADDAKMRVHTGLVDQTALSSRTPAEVLAEVLRVLHGMGMEIKKENEFRLRCTRVRRRKAGATTGLGLGSVMSIGSGTSPFSLMSSASTGRTDSRGLPLPSSSSIGILSSGGLKGMLLRRGSSQSSHHPSQLPRSESEPFGSPSASSVGLATPPLGSEPLYGEHSVDSGDEVKFVVELCRMKNLPGLYLLNIKRLRGSVWSFKFIYQTVLERCETLTH